MTERATHRYLLLGLNTLACALLVLGFTFQVVGQEKPKDTYVLKGAPMGGVKFDHKGHAETRKTPCEKCHHPSKPEKPPKATQQACIDCHTKPAQPGMKTGLQAAFHNASAQAGTCIDCHKAENAKSKAAPVKCMDCHKKENT